ncbi:unnamed protein product [Enterobius vermicularis]|uniref:Ubiquitin-like domain-containing protein n=1 Tax=Enterobius vermicularis TaxID=51028 RepID=A0A0N4V8F3_ENTVE|nr:unnamed protein product [Enterobius vermicularis]
MANAEELEDDREISYYDAVKNSVVELRIKEEKNRGFDIPSTTGRMANLSSGFSAKAENLRTEARTEKKLNNSRVLLDYDIEKNSTVLLIIRRSATEQINFNPQMEKMANSTLHLFKTAENAKMKFDQHDFVHKNFRTPADDSFKNSQVPRFSAEAYESVPITVRSTGGALSLAVQLSDSVRDLKQKINNKTGIPIEKQQLLLDSEKLEDNRRLSECKIRENSALYLIVQRGKTTPINAGSLAGKSTKDFGSENWRTLAGDNINSGSNLSFKSRMHGTIPFLDHLKQTDSSWADKRCLRNSSCGKIAVDEFPCFLVILALCT